MTLEELLEKLKDDNPKERRKACNQLAKLGDPEAIIELSNVYRRKDEDAGVREAAGNALSALAAKEMGGGSPILGRLNIVLGLIFTLLLIVNVIVRVGGGESDGEGTFSTTPSNRDELLTLYATDLVQTQGVITALTTEWTLGAGKLTCAAIAALPPQAPLSPIDQITFPDFAFATDLNQVILKVGGVYSQWQVACQSAEKGTAEQATAALQALNEAQTALNAVAVAIDEATFNPMPTVGPTAPPTTPTATVGPTNTPGPTATITLTPLPTVDPNIIRDLERLIGNAQAAVTSLLNDRWLVVQEGGTSPFGCSVSPIDPDYSGADAVILAQEPDLGDAINLVNQALAFARNSTQAYQTGCQNSSLSGQIITQGIADAQQALSNLDIALQVVQQYKSRGQ